VLYADPGLTLPGTGKIDGHQEQDQAGLVSCAQLAKIPALGRCPAGAAVAAVSTNIGDTDLATATWPAEHVSARRLPIAGCTLAASIAAGLADRKRPFSMMRLAGAPLGGLPSSDRAGKLSRC
jgi:hypothetical protein